MRSLKIKEITDELVADFSALPRENLCERLKEALNNYAEFTAPPPSELTIAAAAIRAMKRQALREELRRLRKYISRQQRRQVLKPGQKVES
jgi:7-keto-8-aminopelargonate synthetase-like enzyme